MSKYRDADDKEIAGFRSKFLTAIDVIFSKIQSGDALPRVSKAVTEALFVGVMNSNNAMATATNEEARARFDIMLHDPLFSVDALKEGLSAPTKVIGRLSRAIEIFSGQKV